MYVVNTYNFMHINLLKFDVRLVEHKVPCIHAWTRMGSLGEASEFYSC